MGNPTVNPIVEALHDGGFIVSESNGHRSRDSIVLASGMKYLAGMVLGALTVGAGAVVAALGTNTGNGAFGAVTLNAVATQIGVYTLAYTSAANFTVTAPNGATSNGSNGVAFNALGIGFTITAGGTPFVAGDGFTFTVTDAPGNPVAVAAAKAGSTGNGTSSAVTVSGYAPKAGIYTVTFVEPNTNLGAFVVEDPQGLTIGHGNVGTAFTGGGLTFTIADGATDFVSGDQFRITVASGTGKHTQWNPGSGAGAAVVSGICFATKDATLVDRAGVNFARDGEVNGLELIWPTGATAATIAQGTAQLKALGILTR